MRFTIHRFDSVSSTNDVAIRMADEGAPEGTVVVAGEQTAGRGRHGREWSSPAGCGLYLSLVLRPPRPFDQLWQTAFVASVAAADAIRQVSGLPALIKWPNDVLIAGRKVCGILIEVIPHPALTSVVLGIGINVNTPAFPPELAETATSIALELDPPRLMELADVERTLLESVRARYAQYLHDGFPAILKAWRELDCTAGRSVAVSTPEYIVEGVVVGVDSNGDLLVEREDGTTVRLFAGEVIFPIREHLPR